MTSDSSIFLKRIRHLSQALVISGALNIGVLSLLLYWVLRERPPTTYCELKPASYEQQQIPLADGRGYTEVLSQLSQLSFPQLVNRLSHTQMIEDGFAERDLALACMMAFHHFDIQRALPKNAQPQQKRLFSWKPKNQESPITLVIFPDLKQFQFEAISKFARTERWPLTSEGLFLLLQSQKKNKELNDNLLETFVLTPEFWTVELLFNRSEQHLTKQEILTMLLEGDWLLLKQFVDQQRKVQDLSDARRQKFLLDYLKARSPLAAVILLKIERDFSVKKLDDQQVLAILKLMPIDLQEGEQFAKEMLMSPRSTSVWRQASQWLYLKSGEAMPSKWEHQLAVDRFIPAEEKKQKFEQATPSFPQLLSLKEHPPKMSTSASLQPVTSTKTEPIKASKPIKVISQSYKSTTKTPSNLKLANSLSSPSTQKENLEKTKSKSLPSTTHLSYCVQEGDSLWKIARRFGVKIEDIRKINKMPSDVLKPGTLLKIPCCQEKKVY